jgi:hypothetical protein
MGMIAGDLRDGSRCGYRLELSHFSSSGAQADHHTRRGDPSRG